MSDKYPEWFIGGPLHGLDKLQEYPETKDWAAVMIEDPSIPDGNHAMGLKFNPQVWLYRRCYVTVMKVVPIYFWWDGRLTSTEEALCKLADLIMKPHVLEEVTTHDQRM